MGAVYLLTLRQLAGRWRLSIMTVLAVLPVLVAILMLHSTSAPSIQEFEDVAFSAMLAGSIGPLIVLAIASASFGNEIDDRTLANLMLSPTPRWQIALPKLLATMTLAAPFIAASAALTSHIAFMGDARATLSVTVAALAAVALYSAAFVWLGLATWDGPAPVRRGRPFELGCGHCGIDRGVRGVPAADHSALAADGCGLALGHPPSEAPRSATISSSRGRVHAPRKEGAPFRGRDRPLEHVDSVRF